jgi:hypothetical protein
LNRCKSKLASLNRTGLLSLIQDLYAAHRDNQTFLHARFELGENVLKLYKQTIDRWLWLDVLQRQVTSVAKARQAISNYKKAVGDSVGMAELMVFYCERAAGFCGSDSPRLSENRRRFRRLPLWANGPDAACFTDGPANFLPR